MKNPKILLLLLGAVILLLVIVVPLIRRSANTAVAPESQLAASQDYGVGQWIDTGLFVKSLFAKKKDIKNCLKDCKKKFKKCTQGAQDILNDCLEAATNDFIYNLHLCDQKPPNEQEECRDNAGDNYNNAIDRCQNNYNNNLGDCLKNYKACVRSCLQQFGGGPIKP